MDKKKLFWSIAPGVVISGVFLYVLLVGMGDGEKQLTQVWSEMKLWPAVAATLLYLLGHLLRGLRCAWILRPYQRISTWDATQLVWIGYAANNVLPARLGEFVRASVLTIREKVPYGISLSTLLVERILDGMAIVGILWVAALYMPANTFVDSLMWVAGLIFLGAFAVVMLARFWKSMFLRLITFFCQPLPEGIRDKVEGLGHKILEGTECLQWDRRLPGILLMSLLIWVVEGSMFLLMLSAFGLPMTLVAAYLTMTITNLGVLVPSTPSNMGTFHFFCTKGLLVAGAISTVSTGLSYAIAVHLLQVLPVTVLGLWSLYAYGFNLRMMWSADRSAGPVTAPSAPTSDPTASPAQSS